MKRILPRFFAWKQACPLKQFPSGPGIVLSDDCVAFTSELFEFLAAQNPHGAARIANDLPSLQNTCCQGNLHRQARGITVQDYLKPWSRSQNFLQCADSHPESTARNLHDLPKWACAKTQDCWHPRGSFVPDESYLNTLSLVQFDHKRDQTFIREMDKFGCSVRLVKTEVMGQAEKF
jgi:hypothetical protein